MSPLALATRVHRQYWAAEHADAQLSAILSEYTNGRRNRWTLTAQDLQHPKVRAALKIKLDADDALHRLFAERHP